MNTVPKMLPYLAHTYGLTDQRAEQLWHEAGKFAGNATGEFETSKYWKSAYERLVNLMKAEAFVSETPETAAWALGGPCLGQSLVLVTDLLAEMSANTRCLFDRNSHHIH